MNMHFNTATKRHVTGARTEDIYSMVQRVYDAANQNVEAAIDATILEIRKRPSLHEQAYRIAAERLVGELMRRDRGTLLRGGSTGAVVEVPDIEPNIDDLLAKHSKQSAASMKARALAREQFSVKLTGLYLTKFRCNGEEFTLGKATPEMLRPVAGHYQAQGATMVRTARWLEKVIASAKEGQPIHKSLTLAQLTRLRKEAMSSAV